MAREIGQNTHIASYPSRVHRGLESKVAEEINSTRPITNAGLPELLYKIFYFNGTNNSASSRFSEAHRYEANFFLWTNQFVEASRSSQFDYLVTPIGRMEPQVYYDLFVTTGVLMRILHDHSARLDSLIKEIDESGLDFLDGIRRSAFLRLEGRVAITPPYGLFKKGCSVCISSWLRGHFFEQPLRLNDRGALVPSDAFKEFALNVKEKMRPETLEEGIKGPTSCMGPCHLGTARETDWH